MIFFIDVACHGFFPSDKSKSTLDQTKCFPVLSGHVHQIVEIRILKIISFNIYYF